MVNVTINEKLRFALEVRGYKIVKRTPQGTTWSGFKRSDGEPTFIYLGKGVGLRTGTTKALSIPHATLKAILLEEYEAVQTKRTGTITGRFTPR